MYNSVRRRHCRQFELRVSYSAFFSDIGEALNERLEKASFPGDKKNAADFSPKAYALHTLSSSTTFGRSYFIELAKIKQRVSTSLKRKHVARGDAHVSITELILLGRFRSPPRL